MKAGRSGWIAAAAAGVIAALCASGVEGLSDTDPYRHVAYAQLLWASGLTLRGHPFLPQTILGHTGVDLWWGFHLLMMPFSWLGVLTGARLAGVSIAAAQAGGMAWLAARVGQRRGWLFALLPTFTSAYFIARGFAARPGHLTIPLVAVSLAAGAGELGPAWAAGAAFLHGLLHLSSPLSPLFVVVGSLGSLVNRSPRGGRAIAASVGGLLLALVLRPDRASYVSVAVFHNLGALGHLAIGRLPESGAELLPIDLARFADEVGREGLVLLAMIGLGRGRARCGSGSIRWAALLAAAVGAGLCFQSGRFLDYTLPFLALAAAVWAPVELPLSGRGRVAAAGALLGLASSTPAHIRRAWKFSNAFIAPPESFEALAVQVRQHVPAGTLLVTDDLLQTGVLFASLPEYAYLGAYDPILLYQQSPGQYWRWYHLITQGRDCPQGSCPGGEGDGTEVAHAIRSLGSDWFVSFGLRDGYTVLKPLHEHPELFELVATAPSRSGRMSLWRVRPEVP